MSNQFWSQNKRMRLQTFRGAHLTLLTSVCWLNTNMCQASWLMIVAFVNWWHTQTANCIVSSDSIEKAPMNGGLHCYEPASSLKVLRKLRIYWNRPSQEINLKVRSLQWIMQSWAEGVKLLKTGRWNSRDISSKSNSYNT